MNNICQLGLTAVVIHSVTSLYGVQVSYNTLLYYTNNTGLSGTNANNELYNSGLQNPCQGQVRAYSSSPLYLEKYSSSWCLNLEFNTARRNDLGPCNAISAK